MRERIKDVVKRHLVISDDDYTAMITNLEALISREVTKARLDELNRLKAEKLHWVDSDSVMTGIVLVRHITERQSELGYEVNVR